MFWNKDFWTKVRKNSWGESFYPMWKSHPLLIAPDLDLISKNLAETNTKLNLILDHLKLKYVPESEKKEPAKLVEKGVNTFKVVNSLYDSISNAWANKLDADVISLCTPKPKRKYTKRKKTSKK